jgi:hypothetical protein
VSSGPICPNCRQPLRDRLRQEQLAPTPANEPGMVSSLTVVFCGSCGWTLEVLPGRMMPPGRLAEMQEVAPPEDETSLEGQFQLRCRELVTATRALGFDPNVWVPMINSLGALGAAKKLLADHHVLVATPWLVVRGRSELTLEREIARKEWVDLFSEDERAEAARRLAEAEREKPGLR